MDRETLSRIFEPFFTTKSQEGGTGLGLASAYGIIRNHGGVINAFSEPGRGTTFNIYLPTSGRTPGKEPERKPDGELLRGSGGILLVDDEPMILDSAAGLLESLGYTVYRASTGREATAAYRAGRDRIDLVILDMILPGLSGSEVLKALREIDPGVKSSFQRLRPPGRHPGSHGNGMPRLRPEAVPVFGAVQGHPRSHRPPVISPVSSSRESVILRKS